MKPNMNNLYCYALVFSLSLLTIACNNAQVVEQAPAFTPAEPTAQPIEYGTTLDELAETAIEPPKELVKEAEPEDKSALENPSENRDGEYTEIMWDALVPAEFTADAIMAKYETELASIQDGSPEGNDLFAKIQEEFDNAPVKQDLNDTLIKLPGFITPLEYSGDVITQFLLVPYYGACIHVPPPPANQTILVTTDEENGVKIEDSYYPVWVMGRISTDGVATELAQAGYVIQDSTITPYQP